MYDVYVKQCKGAQFCLTVNLVRADETYMCEAILHKGS